MKRFGLALGLLAIFFLLAAPMIVTAQEEAYAEGISFAWNVGRGSGGGSHYFNATKQVDGSWSQTTVVSRYSTVAGTSTCTGVLSGDPDGLEVSEDLGWGGLEGEATLVCSGRGESGVPHVYVFHLQLTADEAGYTEDPASWYFTRHAEVQGQILRDGAPYASFPLTGTYARNVYGNNFSDQWPGY